MNPVRIRDEWRQNKIRCDERAKERQRDGRKMVKGMEEGCYLFLYTFMTNILGNLTTQTNIDNFKLNC